MLIVQHPGWIPTTTWQRELYTHAKQTHLGCEWDILQGKQQSVLRRTFYQNFYRTAISYEVFWSLSFLGVTVYTSVLSFTTNMYYFCSF